MCLYKIDKNVIVIGTKHMHQHILGENKITDIKLLTIPEDWCLIALNFNCLRLSQNLFFGKVACVSWLCHSR